MDTISRIEKAHNDFDIEYGGFLSNHINHGFIALDKLGASTERIDSYYEDYLEHDVLGNKIEPAVKTNEEILISDDNLLEYKGKRIYYNNLFDFFINKLNSPNSSIKDIVQKYYSHLSSGLAGSALHPMIHLGLSLDYKKSTTAIAEGLAYSVHSYFLMIDYKEFETLKQQNTLNDNFKSLSLTDIIKEVYNNNELWNKIRTTSEEGFQKRLKLFQNNNTILNLLSKWNILYEKPLSKEHEHKIINNISNELAKITTLAYYSSACRDFFLLHGVTGCYSTISISKYFDNFEDKMQLFFHFAFTLIATYITEGSVNVFDFDKPSSNFDSWDSITDNLLSNSSDKHDVHLIKVIYVCRQFSKLYPHDEPLYLNTAGGILSTNIKKTSDYDFGTGLKQHPETR